MTIRKNITLTEQQETWIKSLIARGDYTNESEYFRDLLRRDQEDRARREVIRSAVREGLESGVSDRQIPALMKDVEDRLKANGKL